MEAHQLKDWPGTVHTWPRLLLISPDHRYRLCSFCSMGSLGFELNPYQTMDYPTFDEKIFLDHK
jgi:hypothetical protein